MTRQQYFDPATWTTSRTIVVGVGMTALSMVVGLAIGTEPLTSFVVGGVLGCGSARSIGAGMKRAKVTK
jgi:hypothetical protein